MSNDEKRMRALEGIRKVCSTLLLGVDPEVLTEDKIFCNVPDGSDEDHIMNKDFPNGIAQDDPIRDNYLGMDAVDGMLFMIYLDQEFNKEIDDTYFVPRNDIDHRLLWRYRPVKDLVDYIAENVLD